MLDKVSEDMSNVVNWFSAVNGNWYFYIIDGNRNIRIEDAIPAEKGNYNQFKELYDDFINRNSENVRSYVSEAGYTERADSDIFERFINGRTENSDGLGYGDSSFGQGTRRLRIDTENLSADSRKIWKQRTASYQKAIADGDVATAERMRREIAEDYGYDIAVSP